jgi:hypothetical protein
VDSVVVNGDYPLEEDERGEFIIPTKDDEIRRVVYMSAALVADEVVAFRKKHRS